MCMCEWKLFNSKMNAYGSRETGQPERPRRNEIQTPKAEELTSEEKRKQNSCFAIGIKKINL